jgi:putative transcription antitermination factor YqgF
MNHFWRFVRLLLGLLVPCGLHALISPGASRATTSPISFNSNTIVRSTTFFRGGSSDDEDVHGTALPVLDDHLLAPISHETTSSTHIRVTKTLGIDYGLARTGLALSGGYVAAQPVAIITGPDYATPIINCIRLYQVEQMVLGWPLEKNGTISEQALLTKEFGLSLKETVCRNVGNIPLYLCDERYTSKAARATLENGSNEGLLANGNEGLPLVDAISACMILDSFFGGEVISELTLPDDVLLECMQEYEQKKGIVDAERKAATANRDLQTQRRRDAIARDKKLRAEMTPSQAQKLKKKRKR